MTTTSGNLTNKKLELVLTNSPSRAHLTSFFLTGDIWRKDLKLYFRFSPPEGKEAQRLLKHECGITSHHNILALLDISSLVALSSDLLEIEAAVSIISEPGWFTSDNFGKLLMVDEYNKVLQVRILQSRDGQSGTILLVHKLYN